MNNPPIPHSERLIVVVGPSGAGKDSVLAAWAALRGAGDPPVHQARRTISRPAEGSAGEQHEPVTPEQFTQLLLTGAFATAWQAHGLGYGVRHAELTPLAQGQWVVLNSSRAHLPVLRQQAPGLAVVQVTAPAELRTARIAARGREDTATVAARVARELPPIEAELTLVNDSSLDEVAQALQRWWKARSR
ncbi:MAG: phosphonate metabolism protein/1,5-bisphosphokinase (PRPP-forming) PhnN [Rhizobacter sp.]